MASHLKFKKSGVFIQNSCLHHRYIRSKDLSSIVERPERLRAVNIGLASALARLETLFSEKASNATVSPSEMKPGLNDLAEEMNRLNLNQDASGPPVSVVNSDASVDLLNHPAVKFIHGDVERDVYLENLLTWARDSVDKIRKDGSEIPDSYSQGDLYLCPESISAIQGAVGTVCEVVDRVVSSTRSKDSDLALHRAFVAIRPPGHHCGENTPSGFCFVNNVAVGAAHAHLKYGIKRIVIFDIDLHHGNGTQSIVWQINEETYRQTLENEEGAPNLKTGPEFFYGSIHDILSYPCEDGKVELVQAASVSIHKAHGQYIENIHLETYTSEEHFWEVLYKQKYSKLLIKAQEFLDHTGGPGDDVMFFISCGMDACEHEYESMSRHNRKVPTSFYYRFARDTCALSDKYANGRVISVLEGGYSDRALISGAMAHLVGLVDVPSLSNVDEEWWSLDNLVKLESATKKRRGGRTSLPGQSPIEPWLERTLTILSPLDNAATHATASAPRYTVPIPPSSMTLREKSKPKVADPAAPTPPNKPMSKAGSREKPKSELIDDERATTGAEGTSTCSAPLQSSPNLTGSEPVTKTRLPKIILKLGNPPQGAS